MRAHLGRITALALAAAAGLTVPGGASAAPAAGAVVDVAAGGFHGCALTSAGAVLCWGDGTDGQLGTGSRDSAPTPVPARLPGPATAVETSDATTCAVVQRKAWCWGENEKGQIGDGTTTQRDLPVPVAGLPGEVVSLASGAYGTCALTTAGAYCWGSNRWGMVGDGTTVNRLTPTAVVGLPAGVRDISIDLVHACAATDSGAYCWGRNESGQLGNGESEEQPHLTPIRVSLLDGPVASIDTGVLSTCASYAGSPYCWGLNHSGQLGETDDTVQPTPKRVPMPGTLTQLSTDSHTCGGNESGMYCWGHNRVGQLGNGGTTDTPVPTAVRELPAPPSQLSVGGAFTRAVSGPDAYCWGGNSLHQLGDGSGVDSATPVRVPVLG